MLARSEFEHKPIFHLFIDAHEGYTVDEDGFQLVKLTKKQKWQRHKMIRDQLASADVMSAEEVQILIGKIRTQLYDVTRDLDKPNRYILYHLTTSKLILNLHFLS